MSDHTIDVETAHDKNGAVITRMSLKDKVGIGGFIIIVMSVVFTAAVQYAGMVAHIDSPEKHETHAQKRMLISEIVNAHDHSATSHEGMTPRMDVEARLRALEAEAVENRLFRDAVTKALSRIERKL